MRIFCVSMTVPVESRLTMRKSRNGLLRFPHGNRIGHQKPLSYEPRESLPNRAARGPILLRDRRPNPCADRAATFANCEPDNRVHGARSDQLDRQLDVVARPEQHEPPGEED